MSLSQRSLEADRLKAEGNALFVKNDFTGASIKYTEALKQDGNNAILYCNRAACSFGLNRLAGAGSVQVFVTHLHLFQVP